jgi:hypothetical protein
MVVNYIIIVKKCKKKRNRLGGVAWRDQGGLVMERISAQVE